MLLPVIRGPEVIYGEWLSMRMAHIIYLKQAAHFTLFVHFNSAVFKLLCCPPSLRVACEMVAYPFRYELSWCDSSAYIRYYVASATQVVGTSMSATHVINPMVILCCEWLLCHCYFNRKRI